MTKLFKTIIGKRKIYMLIIIDLFFKMPKKVVLSDEHFIKKWSGMVIHGKINEVSLHSVLKSVGLLKSQKEVLTLV